MSQSSNIEDLSARVAEEFNTIREEINNTPTSNTSLICGSGRWYCNADFRWVTCSDDNYGSSYYQFNESGGSGEDPICEWEHLGEIIPSGKKINKLFFLARANSTQITDFIISIQIRVPNPLTRYQSGIDNDGEMNNIEIYRGNFVEVGWSGNMADRRMKEIVLNHEVKDLSQLSIYIKPIGVNTGTRYLTTSWTWEIE